MRRRGFLCAPLYVLPAFAGIRDDTLQIVSKMASALSSGEPGEFLACVDKSAPDFNLLRDNVFALATEAEVTSSIEIIRTEGDVAELDWSMELRSRETGTVAEQRREAVTVRVSRGKIQSLKPVSFFAPLHVKTSFTRRSSFTHPA
jgi:hypothetical protein